MTEFDKTVAVEASGAEATILGTTIKCPVCQTENAPNEMYCGECGFLLTSTPGEEVPEFEAAARPKLVDSADREYFLRDGENTVGRESADVLLSDPTVSRRHAVITLEGGKVSVTDLGSTNGTYAEGVQIQANDKVEVRDDDELKFGSAVVTLKLPETEEVEEEAAGDAPPEAQPSADDSPPPEGEAEEPAAEVAPPLEGGVGGGEEPEPEPEPEAVVPPVAKLIGAAGEFDIVPGANTIGRRADNNIVLADSYASGSHAVIIAGEDGFRLTDVGSTNGTSLCGVRIEPNVEAVLSDGDEIVFGQTTLTFQVEHGTAD